VIDKLIDKILKKRELKKTVVYLVILFTLLFAICIGIISSVVLFNMKIDTIEHNQKLILKQIKYEINDFLNDVENISMYLKNNFKESDVFISGLIKTHKSINTIVILNDKGKVDKLYSNCKRKICGIGDYSSKNLFTKVKNNLDTYWSSVFLSTTEKTPTLTYSFKFQEKIIVIYVTLKDLSFLTHNLINNDNTNMIRLFDKNATLILNKDKPDFVKKAFNAQYTESFSKLIDVKNEYELAKFKNICFGSLDYGMYTTIEKTKWKLLIRQNYSIVQEYLFKILFILVVVIVLFTFMAVYFSSRFLNDIFISLDKFKKQTSNIANGNYNENLEKTHFSDLNELFVSFEKMRVDIKNREKNLTKSLENFKVLINSTMEGIVLHDTNICLDINDIAVKTLGFKDKKELIGQPISKFISLKYRKNLESYFKDNKKFYSLNEYEILTKNGIPRQVVGQGRTILYEGKKVRISTFLDITNIKKQEKMLFQQSKMATIGEMLINIAHQWRQPLSTIRTLSTGMKLEKELEMLDNNRLVSGLEMIGKNTEELSRTIDDFANYFIVSKNSEKFNLSEAINSTLHFIESTLIIENIIVKTQLDDSLLVEGNSNELRQALINILSNSKDALSQMNIKDKFIIIETQVVNNKIILIIKDSGLGIKDSLLSKVFEPYITTKHNSSGTGIGLYMTHQIITLHMKGTIYLENSTFNLNDKLHKGLLVRIELDKPE